MSRVKTLILLIVFGWSINMALGKIIKPVTKKASPSSKEIIVMKSLWPAVYGEAMEKKDDEIFIKKTDPDSKKSQKEQQVITKEDVDPPVIKIDQDKKSKTKTDEKVVQKKEDPSKGNKYVQEQLRKNREKIKKLHQKEEKVVTNKYIQDQLKKNREAIKKLHQKKNLMDREKEQEKDLSPKDFIAKMREEQNQALRSYDKDTKDTWSKWKNEVEETLNRWRKEKNSYLKRVDDYKSGLAEFGSGNPISSKEIKKKSIKTNLGSNLSYGKNLKYGFHIVDQGMNITVRDQGRRSTCSSFAGILALEILLKQNGHTMELSPQYLYWASKSDCQNFPCSRRGSWIGYGLDHSIKQRRVDIPLEKSCPYNKSNLTGNETQIPLTSSCNQGVVQVVNYRYLNNINEVISSLKKNRPVMGGFKLSPNFYSTDGFLLEGSSTGTVDQHAKGHAFLIIGLMELPPGEKKRRGGNYCFIMVNSWGEGFGKGGYACLSESWIRNYRMKNPFVVIDSVKVNL